MKKNLWLISPEYLLPACVLFFVAISTNGLSRDIYFDDSGPDIIKVGNTSYYELGFRKVNGSFAYILDKSTNQEVCKGSRYENLWGTYTPPGNPGYIGSSLYSATGDNLFTYSRDAESGELQLIYTPGDAAHQYGLLVMPYTNPTWWDDTSPMVLNQLLPLTINDIAVLDKNGNPRWETYKGNAGFIVSPYASFVQDRLDELMDQLTGGLPSDLVFEDQICARGGIIDFNPSAPDPSSYFSDWLNYTQQNNGNPLSTVMGYDKLLTSETAFCGSSFPTLMV